MTDKYESPFTTRYSSEYMQILFSENYRIEMWRCLWTALARAEHELGLPITQDQVDELENHVMDIDLDVAHEREKEVHHDVMAHIYAYGLVAPGASGIIHLGATSCYVTDNADIIIYREGLCCIRRALIKIISALAQFADKYKSLPTLGYTHYQPAQLTTVGKRATLWIQDFVSDLNELDFVIDSMKLLGCRGTTGTEASFVELFDGDDSKIQSLNKKICDDFGFKSVYDVTGQTYPRKLDSRILNVLSSIAQSAYKMADDIRLLQHDRQLEEPFDKSQIGSSAMAYKRNPMRCERICSLSRYLMALSANASATAAAQWLERSLDDSANRRISMPEGFLCADSILSLVNNVVSGLKVNDNEIKKSVSDYLPFIATENLMMKAVKRGADRQKIHEIIRKCSMKATAEIREGKECRLLEYLANYPVFDLNSEETEKILKPELYIGNCVKQVDTYLKKIKSVLK